MSSRITCGSSTSSAPSSLFFWKWFTEVADEQAVVNDKKSTPYKVTDDPDFPWKFEGRMVLCPQLVRLEEPSSDGPSSSLGLPYTRPFSIGGWTVGGVVALDYADSPVGPYIEYVQLGCVASLFHVLTERGRGRFLLGQVGRKLYVNETKALALCDDVWDLKGYLASTKIVEQHGNVMTKFFEPNNLPVAIPFQSLPMWWTPTITSIWAQILPRLPSLSANATPLPLNKLRITGKAQLVFQAVHENNNSIPRIPLGFGFAVKDLLIEISHKVVMEGD